MKLTKSVQRLVHTICQTQEPENVFPKHTNEEDKKGYCRYF